MLLDFEEEVVVVVEHVLDKPHKNDKDFHDSKVQEERDILVRFLQALHSLDA
jgi:hypothetical protein